MKKKQQLPQVKLKLLQMSNLFNYVISMSSPPMEVTKGIKEWERAVPVGTEKGGEEGGRSGLTRPAIGKAPGLVAVATWSSSGRGTERQGSATYEAPAAESHLGENG